MEEKAKGAETVEEIAETGEIAAEEIETESAKGRGDSKDSIKNETQGERPGEKTAWKQSRDLEYFVEKVQNPDTRQYIQSRVIMEMDYYSEQSRKYKKQYFRFMTAAIILGALIPVASIFSDSNTFMKVLIAALGSAVTAINAYLGLHNSRDLWLSYRNSRQSLLQTLYYYFNGTNTFEQSGNQSQRDKLLIQSCEKELSNQHSGWWSLVKE